MNMKLINKIALGVAISSALSGAAFASSADIETNSMVNSLLNVESIEQIEKTVESDSKSNVTELIYDSQRSIKNSNQITVLQEEVELLDVQIDLQEKKNILKEKREASALAKEIEKNKKLEAQQIQLTEMIAALESELESASAQLRNAEGEIMRLQSEATKVVEQEDGFDKISVVRIHGLGNSMKADLVWDNSLITRTQGSEIADGVILHQVNNDNIVVKKGNKTKTLFMQIHKNIK